MSSSLQLIKLNANFSDYGIMLSPALKTLEHVMIVILEKNGRVYNQRDGFKMFSQSSGIYHLVHDENCRMVPECKSKISGCYDFYHKQRHGFLHLGSDILDMRILEQREPAISLLTECIDLMEDIGNEFYISG